MDYPNETVFLILLEHFVNFVHFLLTTLSVLSSVMVLSCFSVFCHIKFFVSRDKYTEIALILSIQAHKHTARYFKIPNLKPAGAKLFYVSTSKVGGIPWLQTNRSRKYLQ